MYRSATLLLACSMAWSCGGANSNGVRVRTVTAIVDAADVTGTFIPLWGDHYDLSYESENYAAEPGFNAILAELAPRSWRASVGRWEIGFTPPVGGASTDPLVLQVVDREFYRGANTLVEADNPANYDFAYLDAQLAGLTATGAEPFLCFDYMPFTLASEQDPFNANNLGLADPSLTFSNGIRTSPPANDAVYARVVRNTMRHVRGLFAGATDYGVRYFEVGNEPDLMVAPAAPLRYFWTGDRAAFASMYIAIAAAVAADGTLPADVRIGTASYASVLIDVTWAADTLTAIHAAGSQLDFCSYHSYADDPATHLTAMIAMQSIMATIGISAELVNGEWGRRLDGPDPVYDTIDYGLFRAHVIAFMLITGHTFAHEALLRDPVPGTEELGLIRTGPPANKPVSDVYRGLGMLSQTPQALSVGINSGDLLFAGRSPDLRRVVIVFVGDDPGSGNATRLDLGVINLPWGNQPFVLNRYEVSNATSAAGQGVALQESTVEGGGAVAVTNAFGPGPGAGRLVIWELIGP